jgi:c-di-GMP-binding flagellar brake protein YcgR
VGSRIRLVFALEHDAQEVDACVLALSVVRPGPRRSLYRVHCRFVDMPRAERERVVRFVFASQMDFRQRGVA